MPTRRYTTVNTQIFEGFGGNSELPTSRPIAIYYRQSTEAQVGNISTTLQTVDMVAYLQSRGWPQDNILMIDMDGGISGTTKIDERPGMSMLFTLITERKIGAVACQDEDRLFRDVTQIQVNIFIEACKSARVLVITPSMTYDFGHSQLGVFHARQFRFKSEMAAEYINTVVLGKLYAAKRSLMLEGRWAGSSVATGYMVDTRKRLPDGSRNENWYRFVPFEPYAEVVREYFRIFLAHSGNLAQTLRQIRRCGPFYPNPAECRPPDGFKVNYMIRQNADGWCPKTIQSLIRIFTNAMYIGHWVFKDAIVRWNNHPPLVDEDTFFRAFNYLSSVALTGDDNADYNPRRMHTRPSLSEARTEDAPLCSGLIYSQFEGEWREVGTHWVRDRGHYNYVFTSDDGYHRPLWRKKSSYFDAAVAALLLEKLGATFDYTTWETSVEDSIVEFKEQKKLKESQLRQLTSVMDNLVTSLASLSTPSLIREVERKYQEAQTEYERLQEELVSATSSAANIDSIKALKNSFKRVLDSWSTLSTDEKREILHLFLDRIEAAPIEAEGVRLTIFWKDRSVDEVALSRLPANGTVWLPHEIDLLIRLVESGANQVEIAKAFPDRKWKDIAYKYRSMTKKRIGFRPHNYIKKLETYQDYVKRTGSNGCISMTSRIGSRPD